MARLRTPIGGNWRRMKSDGKWLHRLIRKVTPWLAGMALLAGGIFWWDRANYPIPGAVVDPFQHYPILEWDLSEPLSINLGRVRGFLLERKLERADPFPKH
ncbi:MAG: hypothetical protein HKN23_21950 [Verrucomicrobiales bacterium]|nr:hypothetical protein [Verrucomicrobiales bacterium]